VRNVLEVLIGEPVSRDHLGDLGIIARIILNGILKE
jgi:hypothetical protein